MGILRVGYGRIRFIADSHGDDPLQEHPGIRRAVKAKQATYEFHEGPRPPSDGLIRLGLELQAPPRKR